MTRSFRIISVFIVLAGILSLGGCAGNRKNVQYARQQVPAQPVAPPPAVSSPAADNDGSLWQTRSSLNGLFIDTKARQVGDIVTVQIEESSRASNSASTATERKSTFEAGIEKLFGLENWWQDQILPNVKGDWPRIDPFGNPSVKGNLKSKFDGDGETTRSGRLTAFITCRVVAVMPNGNLKIVGTREVMVNDETQMIILSGVIRPRDISENNIILSKSISNAKIAYSGSGIVDDRQRPGWLANLLNNVWPF